MGKQVFLIVINEDEEEVFTELFEFPTLEATNCKLEDLTYGNLDDESIHIYHGMMTSPEFIPKSLNGTAPFIIVMNPDRFLSNADSSEVLFFKGSSDPKILMEKIEDLLSSDDFFPLATSKVKTSDIRLFFGYKMIPVLQVTESSLDDEVIDRAEKISGSMDTLRKETYKV